jgi:hypothetical protein
VARCIELLKGCILWTVCKIVGPHRAPVVLDAIKRLRAGCPVGQDYDLPEQRIHHHTLL